MGDLILELVDQYGYAFFYAALALGPFGIPVPNEVTVMTGGVIGAEGLLNPWLVYVCIFLGLITAVTIGYVIGRAFGKRLINRLRGKERFARYFASSEQLLDKYGTAAICISCFIPCVRYIVPIFMGAYGKRYAKFALYAYSGAWVWTLLFYGIGRQWGGNLSQLLIVPETKLFLVIGCAAAVLFLFWRNRTKKSQT
ncbi:DedA family protein [Paenibacillus chitinolyticus]|uniref:DedA family protein n=1 Tax=Paenibacillus chitinolyticus TaxID=79263 RepID=UPI003D07F796